MIFVLVQIKTCFEVKIWSASTYDGPFNRFSHFLPGKKRLAQLMRRVRVVSFRFSGLILRQRLIFGG